MDLRTESKARGYSEDSTTDLEHHTHKFLHKKKTNKSMNVCHTHQYNEFS